jgi:hypothetical protein
MLAKDRRIVEAVEKVVEGVAGHAGSRVAAAASFGFGRQ